MKNEPIIKDTDNLEPENRVVRTIILMITQFIATAAFIGLPVGAAIFLWLISNYIIIVGVILGSLLVGILMYIWVMIAWNEVGKKPKKQIYRRGNIRIK